MPLPRQVRHHKFNPMALPYVPYASTSAIQPRLVAGGNVAIEANGDLVRRPGFTTHTADNFTSAFTIERFAHWQSWAGVHYVFTNVISSSLSRIYKQQVGTDTTFQLIFTSSTAEPFDFTIANNNVFMANGTDMERYDGTNVRSWGIVGPSIAPTMTDSGAGNVPASIQHTWVYAFGNSTTEHISDVSLVSDAQTTATQNWTLSGSGTTDDQVDRVHLYRTQDGGSIHFEWSDSPKAYTANGSDFQHTDSNTDAQLKATQSPIPTINEEPRAGFQPTLFAGRIWFFKNDSLYYTGFEEVNNGRFEESAPLDNEYRFGQQITGLAATGGFLLVFTRSGIFRISGDSLSTFRRDTLSSTGGVHNRATVASAGDIIGWLDTGNIVRVTNGVEIKEISQPIRSDIETINHSNAHMTFWDDGRRHWLVLMDGGGNKLFIYDFDLELWYPPWSITTPTAVGRGETANGTHRLFLGRTNGSTNVPLRMNTATFQDESTNYSANIITNLLDFTDPDNPRQVGQLESIIVERNSIVPSNVTFLFDEDPKTGTFTAAASAKDTPNRTAGTTLVEQWYDGNRSNSGRRCSIQITWAAANSEFILHAMSVGYLTKD